ncbi:hypothetical protein [Streptomyces sp. JNUCC 63]
MAAPTAVLTTSELITLLADPRCPASVRNAWESVQLTAGYHAKAKYALATGAYYGSRAEMTRELDDWARDNDRALDYLDRALTYSAGDFAVLAPLLEVADAA